MYEDLFIEIGLTKSEIAVYFALLEMGSSTTGPIIKKAGIASGKAYIVLDKLITKGLVTYAIKSGTKYYQAKDPERLLDYLKEKEKELKKKEKKLEKIIPGLRKKFEEKKYRPIAEVFEGTKGFKTFYEWALREASSCSKKIIYIMGVPREANERFQAYLLAWNRRRIELGIEMKIIYNHDCREFGKKREKMKLTEVRYMRQELETPAWIVILGGYVATINVHGTPVCFLIRSEEAAGSYRKYFNILWNQAEK